MKKLFLLVCTCWIVGSAAANDNWQQVNNNYSYTSQTMDLGVGTAVVNFPIGAYSKSCKKEGNDYYAYCYVNGKKYRSLITNISWYQQQSYNQQINPNWNCQITAPIGYNYVGCSNLNGSYYANFYNNGNCYRQLIGLRILSMTLSTTAAIINYYAQPSWNTGPYGYW